MTRTFVLDPVLRHTLRKIGADVDSALEEIGIYTDSNEALHLPEKDYIRFMETIRESIPGDDGVTRIVNIDRIESFSAPSFAAMCSRNGLEFLERFIRYKRLVCPLVFSCKDNGDSVTLYIETLSGEKLPPFLEQLEVAYIVSLLRKATGQYVVPVNWGLTNLGPDIKSLVEFMGVNTRKVAKTEINLSKTDLALPFHTYNDMMWNCLRPGLEQQLLERDDRDVFLREVRQIICRQISGSSCTIESVAGVLCMSVRSLQRRLSENGVHFSQMIAEARHSLAVVYLSNPQLTVSDISYLLGFQEYNSFLRAFRKWEGKGVTEFRRGLRIYG